MAEPQTAPDPEDVVVFRRMEPGDEAFILDSWTKSFGRFSGGSEFAREIAGDATAAEKARWDVNLRLMVQTCLQAFSVLVATTSSDRTTICGYVVYRNAPDLLAWMFVRDNCRGMGLGSDLLRQAGFAPGRRVSVIFARIVALKEFRARGWNLRHNPYWLLALT